MCCRIGRDLIRKALADTFLCTLSCEAVNINQLSVQSVLEPQPFLLPFSLFQMYVIHLQAGGKGENLLSLLIQNLKEYCFFLCLENTFTMCKAPPTKKPELLKCRPPSPLPPSFPFLNVFPARSLWCLRKTLEPEFTLKIGFCGRRGTQDDLKTGCILDTFLCLVLYFGFTWEIHFRFITACSSVTC